MAAKKFIYIVRGDPIEYDGKTFTDGMEIELTKSEAASLDDGSVTLKETANQVVKSTTKMYLIVGTNIKHDGIQYAEGDTIELTAEEAAPIMQHLTAKTEAE